MGQLTLAITATTTVNSAVNDLNGSVNIPAKGYSQQTRDFADAYEQVSDASFAYMVVCNVGDESLFVQLETSTPGYIPFEVVSGGHIIIPACITQGGTAGIVKVNMRSATGAGSRAIIITIES